MADELDRSGVAWFGRIGCTDRFYPSREQRICLGCKGNRVRGWWIWKKECRVCEGKGYVVTWVNSGVRIP